MSFRPPEIIWAYWREVLDIPENAFMGYPCYIFVAIKDRIGYNRRGKEVQNGDMEIRSRDKRRKG